MFRHDAPVLADHDALGVGVNVDGAADLHDRRHPVHHNDLVAPVELIGLARRERQRHKGICRRAHALLAPGDRIAADSSVAALKAEAA